MAVDANCLQLRPPGVLELAERFDRVRWTTEALVAPLSTEDCAVASHAGASPANWHLAHTTWFIEQYLLAGRMPGYEVFDARFWEIFQSSPRHGRDVASPRCAGALTRPCLDEIFDYRSCVDLSLVMLMHADRSRELAGLVEIAIQHEQRHQERLLADIKHLFATNPLRPVFLEMSEESDASVPATSIGFVDFDPGVRAFGNGGETFCLDEERPRHRQFINAFALADRLVTNGEWREFMSAGGYRAADHWLDEGWRVAVEENWEAPLYWFQDEGAWKHDTLTGTRPIADAEPVAHVSYYEADAFARWAGKRLPTEFEWELAGDPIPVAGNFLERGRLRPNAATPIEGRHPTSAGPTRIRQLFGDVWEWTSSPYVAYPGYRRGASRRGASEGGIGAHAKVLRGGSCVTPAEQIRPTYRRAIDPATRVQVTGLRLAEDR